MIRLRSILFILVLSGCKPDEPAKQDPPAPDSAALQERSQENARLLNEKFALTRQLDQLISNSELESHERFLELQREIRQAEDRFGEIRRTHPRLQKLNRELTRSQQRARMDGIAGRPQAADRAQKKNREIRGEILKVSKSLPELEAARTAIDNLNRDLADLRRTLATGTPEGKALLDKITALEARITGQEEEGIDER